jgi:hypothetical protein
MKLLKVQYLLSLLFFLLFNAISDANANDVSVDIKYNDKNGEGKKNLQKFSFLPFKALG